MNATIEKLTVKINDRTLDLTMEEAKALQAELNLQLGDTHYWARMTAIRDAMQPCYPRWWIETICSPGNVCVALEGRSRI